MTIGISAAGHPLGRRIQTAHPHIHQFHDPTPSQGIPARGFGRELLIDYRQHLGIGDQSGAIHRDRDHPEVHRPGHQRRTELGQPLQQLHPVAHLRRGPRPADPQLSSHLRGHRLPVIDTPLPPILEGHRRHPPLTQPPRRQQPSTHRPTLITLSARQLRQQRRLCQGFEHRFDNRTARRQKRASRRRSPEPPDETASVDFPASERRRCSAHGAPRAPDGATAVGDHRRRRCRISPQVRRRSRCARRGWRGQGRGRAHR